jgi:amino acid transporter
MLPDGLTICLMVMIFGGFTTFIHTFDASSFVTTYFPIPFFVVLFFGFKFIKKSKIVQYADMDFETGCSADIGSETGPKSAWKKLAENI